jgi:hypothetical protein
MDGCQRLCFHGVRPLIASICHDNARGTTLISIWNYERRSDHKAAHIELPYIVFDAHWLADDVQTSAGRDTISSVR